MKVAHIGPPLARQGGPAGYLYQLHRAACEAGQINTQTMPPLAPPKMPRRATLGEWARTRLGGIKRRVVGPPTCSRPSDAVLAADHGHVERVMTEARANFVVEAEASLASALASSPDILFCHDTAIAEHVLERRARDQQIWLMIHNPMPVALYLTWNWGVPERDWRDVISFPDVRRWTRWETDLWRAVDRLILPCPEALEEVVRIEPAVASVTTPISWVLSGASADKTVADVDRSARRHSWNLPLDVPVGLYLGNHQAYRGFDALVAAVQSLDSTVPAGIIAVAGPPFAAVPRHPRLRALGHVADVGGLLAAADFVINVNRFSLFDLSTIEALEAGKPLLLHAIGGNRTFKQLGAGAEMLADLDRATIASGLARLFAMSREERRRLAEMSKTCYDAHLTRAHLWARHQALYAVQPVSAVAS